MITQGQFRRAGLQPCHVEGRICQDCPASAGYFHDDDDGGGGDDLNQAIFTDFYSTIKVTSRFIKQSFTIIDFFMRVIRWFTQNAAKIHTLHLFIFHPCVFTNVSSNCLPGRMHSNTGCIYLTLSAEIYQMCPQRACIRRCKVTLVAFFFSFLQCAFSNVS